MRSLAMEVVVGTCSTATTVFLLSDPGSLQIGSPKIKTSLAWSSLVTFVRTSASRVTLLRRDLDITEGESWTSSSSTDAIALGRPQGAVREREVDGAVQRISTALAAMMELDRWCTFVLGLAVLAVAD